MGSLVSIQHDECVSVTAAFSQIVRVAPYDLSLSFFLSFSPSRKQRRRRIISGQPCENPPSQLPAIIPPLPQFYQYPNCPHPHKIPSVPMTRFFGKVPAYSEGRFERPPRCDEKDLWNPVLRIPHVFLPSYSTRPLRIFSFSTGLLDSSPSDVPSMLKGVGENCWYLQRAWGGGDESC